MTAAVMSVPSTHTAAHPHPTSPSSTSPSAAASASAHAHKGSVRSEQVSVYPARDPTRGRQLLARTLSCTATSASVAPRTSCTRSLLLRRDSHTGTMLLRTHGHARRSRRPRNLLVRRDSHTGTMLLRTRGRARRSRRPRPSWHHSTHAAFSLLRKGTHAAIAVPGLLDFAARAQRLFPCSGSPPSFSAGRFFLSYLQRITPRPHTRTHACPRTDSHCSRRIAPRLHARTHARARTNDRRRTTRRADRRGVADWKTAGQGNMERTLTAAAPPPLCDPYRHAHVRITRNRSPRSIFWSHGCCGRGV